MTIARDACRFYGGTPPDCLIHGGRWVYDKGYCDRSPLRRYSPLKPSRGTVWPREVRELIVERDDGHCVCARAGFPLEVIAKCPVYPVELDHVRASGALGMKSRSTLDNGVCLSGPCHRWKTDHGKDARPLLLAYIDRHENNGL